MERENAALDLDSPPAGPSAWQQRFGKRSAPSSHAQHVEGEGNSEAALPCVSEAASPPISERLLRTLGAPPREQEMLSRECADALLGRRNVFADELELRMLTQDKCSGPADTRAQEQRDHADVAAEAREIIRLRFQVETQADVLRQTQSLRLQRQHQQPKKQADGRGSRHVTLKYTGPPATRNITRTSNLDREPPRHRQKSDGRTGTRVRQNDNQRSEEGAVPREPLERERQRCACDSGAATKGGSSRKMSRPKPPPRQLPMEQRQQLLRQTREARRLKLAEEHQLQKTTAAARSDNNQEEFQEQRRLEEEIKRLTAENQQASAFEEQLQSRKARLQSLSALFGIWRRHVVLIRQQEEQVVAALHWRVMKSVVSSWRRLSREKRQVRAAEQARQVLVHERQTRKHAEQFYRLKLVPKWFYRWTAAVAQRKELRAVEGAAVRRRAQTERLLERLLRTNPREEAHPEVDERQNNDVEGTVELERSGGKPPMAAMDSIRGSTRNYAKINRTGNNEFPLRQQRSAAWGCSKLDSSSSSSSSPPRSAEVLANSAPSGSQSQSSTLPLEQRASNNTAAAATVATASVDSLYRAMEQRAAERKRRREALKLKYEQLEQKKLEAQEEQRAAREALIVHERVEKKARIRERKLAEARALKEKEQRRDHLIDQRNKARRHNRRRLLFYYALLPWRRQHEQNQRVAQNSRQWHELRTAYAHWNRWKEFVQVRRKLRRRCERERLAEAARHHACALQRHAFRGWMRLRQATKARALAVRRQGQWNSLQRSWTHWHRRLANVRADQQKRAHQAAVELQQTRLQRICVMWRRATCEAKHQRELQREKEQLWRKVRGWLNEEA